MDNKKSQQTIENQTDNRGRHSAPVPGYPQRVQGKRIKGWTAPDNTLYVGRPTIFSNPFNAKEVGHARAVELFQSWLQGKLDNQHPDLIVRRKTILKNITTLQGLNLSCSCPMDKPCHIDVLLELANRG